jgi:inner membrane protein
VLFHAERGFFDGKVFDLWEQEDWQWSYLVKVKLKNIDDFYAKCVWKEHSATVSTASFSHKPKAWKKAQLFKMIRTQIGTEKHAFMGTELETPKYLYSCYVSSYEEKLLSLAMLTQGVSPPAFALNNPVMYSSCSFRTIFVQKSFSVALHRRKKTMDSVTQIVLGAAVGEAVCGKKIGNKAPIWGAVAGTLPDLDVLINPFADTLRELEFHRSLTHSFFFAFLTSPFLAQMMLKIYPKERTNFRDWFWLWNLGFVTHALLDSFTTWGTQLFYPFNDWRVAFESIFVIDPLYTLPFLFFLIAAMRLKKDDPRRVKMNNYGLYVSTGYLLLTLLNKGYMNHVFEKELERQKIAVTRFHTKPSPLNNILWSATAESEEAYYIGYYSLFDGGAPVKFFRFEKNHHLLEKINDRENLNRLIFITDGYFTTEEKDGKLIMNDLRFGQTDGWAKGEGDFVFTYFLEEKDGKLIVSQRPNRLKTGAKMLRQFAERIFGVQP